MLAIKLDSQLQGAATGPTITSEAGLAARKAIRHLVNSLGPSHEPAQRLTRDPARAANGKVKAEDLVKLQVAVLQRYEAGDIDERNAATEMAMLSSIFKGIEIADLQTKLERIELTLGKDSAP